MKWDAPQIASTWSLNALRATLKNIYVTEVEIIQQEVEMEWCHGVSPRWRVCRCFGIVRFHPQIARGAWGEAEAKVRQDLEDERQKAKGETDSFPSLFFWTVHREDETGRKKRKRASSSLPRSSRLCDAQSSGFAILFPIEVRKWYFSSKDIKQRSTK